MVFHSSKKLTAAVKGKLRRATLLLEVSTPHFVPSADEILPLRFVGYTACISIERLDLIVSGYRPTPPALRAYRKSYVFVDLHENECNDCGSWQLGKM